MKVSIKETVNVTDEQRVALARLLDGEGTRKREATRDEVRAFVWTHGVGWPVALDNGWLIPPHAQGDDLDVVGGPGDQGADEDLLGSVADDPVAAALEDLL